jgi:hypothetical protein
MNVMTMKTIEINQEIQMGLLIWLHEMYKNASIERDEAIGNEYRMRLMLNEHCDGIFEYSHCEHECTRDFNGRCEWIHHFGGECKHSGDCLSEWEFWDNDHDRLGAKMNRALLSSENITRMMRRKAMQAFNFKTYGVVPKEF